MSDVIVTRLMTRDDVEPVLELMRASLGEPPLLARTAELFSWKHFDNPFGSSIAIVAESGGRLAGLRAFMRWDMITPERETIRCVRAVDTATHPDFQRRGIFRRLTEEAIEEARDQGVDLIFNTPNDKSGPGYLKMGWVEVGKIGALVRPKRGLLSRPDVSPDLESLLADATPASPPFAPDRAPNGLRTPRSTEYLSWRYSQHPTARYYRVDQEGSVAIVRPNVRAGRTELLIADVFGPDPALVIRKSVKMARSAYVGTWFSDTSPERAASRRSGLIQVPGTYPLTLMARPLRDLGPDVTSMASWDLALGDLELL